MQKSENAQSGEREINEPNKRDGGMRRIFYMMRCFEVDVAPILPKMDSDSIFGDVNRGVHK